jgi:hypothetical protein
VPGRILRDEAAGPRLTQEPTDLRGDVAHAAGTFTAADHIFDLARNRSGQFVLQESEHGPDRRSRDLSAAISVASVRATDRETRAHLSDARDQIAKALDPKFQPPLPALPTGFPFGFEGERDSNPNSIENFDPNSCWPDYSVRRPND